jgi:hypothetical protein
MYKPIVKIFILVILVALTCSCGARTTEEIVPPTNTPSPLPTEELQVPSPTVEPKPIPTETPEIESTLTDPLSTEPDPLTSTWIKYLGSRGDDTLQDVIMTEDGGYLIVGSTNLDFDFGSSGDVYLLKADSNGEVVWEETYGEDCYLFSTRIQETYDGGLLISGVMESDETEGQDIFILKLDQNREGVWLEHFGGPQDEFGGAWPMEDGGYLLGGNIVDPDDFITDPGAPGYGGFANRSNIYLARIDANGEEMWSRSYGGEKNVLASGGVLTQDGSVVVLANIMYFPESGDDIILMKVDQNGDEIWSHTWDEDSITGFGLIQTSDGGFLISASYSASDSRADPQEDFLFIKTDPDGNEVWSTTFGDPDMIDYSKVVVELEGGGYVAAGESSRDLYSSASDISLVKLNADGELLWYKNIQMRTHNMFGTILQLPDGGFLIAGSTVKRGQFDLFLIKTDPEGEVAGQ